MASERKEDILDAAETLFDRKGFAGCTTRDIAEAAGVNIALLAYYFESKEGVFLAVIERRREALLEGLRPAHAPEGLPRLKAATAALTAFMRAHPAYLRVVYREASLEDPETTQREARRVRDAFEVALRALASPLLGDALCAACTHLLMGGPAGNAGDPAALEEMIDRFAGNGERRDASIRAGRTEPVVEAPPAPAAPKSDGFDLGFID